MGVVCSDGIILGTEKIVVNKMMVSGTDKRTYSISREIGCVSCPSLTLIASSLTAFFGSPNQFFG